MSVPFLARDVHEKWGRLFALLKFCPKGRARRIDS